METTFSEDTTLKPVEALVVEVQGPATYERQEGEPTIWFRRFQRFLLQVGTRSALAVYKAELAERGANQSGLEGSRAAQTVPGSWQEAMKKWNWNQRAASYDLEQLERERKQVEADRAARRRQLLDDEWSDSQLMLGTARESLKHGHKFFDRTVKMIQGKPELRTVIHPKTGKEVEMLVQTNREIVYIEHKVGDINKMLMDAGKKARLATGLTTDKAQEAFINNEVDEYADPAQIDRELSEMFAALGVVRRPPMALPERDVGESDELPGGVEHPTGPPDELLSGFDY